VKDGAHEIRHLGNDMAHGDLTDPVDADESSLVLQLMVVVLDEIFVQPARLQRAQAARLSRAQPSGTP
jgi:hypothetical protein